MMLHRQLFTTGINIALARTKPINISKFQSFNSNYSTNLLKPFNSFKPTTLGIKQLPIFSVRYATTTKSNTNKKEQQDQPKVPILQNLIPQHSTDIQNLIH